MSESSLPDAFVSALRDMVEWLRGERVAHAAIGGLAVALDSPQLSEELEVMVRRSAGYSAG